MKISTLSLSIALLALACGDARTEHIDADTSPPIAIGSVSATRESVAEPVFGTGTIAADKTTQVGPRVDGIIDAIYVEVGDRVEAGAPLFCTRKVDYQIRLSEAKYALRLARAEASKAKRDLERIEQLHGEGVASDERLDEVRTAAEIALSRLGAAETALARASQDLEDSVVTAPYAGAITKRYVDEGTMMRTMMSSGSAVVELMKTDVVVAIIQIPEVDLPRVTLGTPARVSIDGVAREYDSFVEILNDRVDATSRAFEVRLHIANTDLAIKPGLFARAELHTQPREATLLDRRAVLGVEGHRYVFVAVEGKAKRRSLRTRELDANRIEILEGLTVGDRVLAGPNLSLIADGTPVSVQLANADR
jgi:RND family efflux transporter MFP subunit